MVAKLADQNSGNNPFYTDLVLACGNKWK